MTNVHKVVLLVVAFLIGLALLLQLSTFKIPVKKQDTDSNDIKLLPAGMIWTSGLTNSEKGKLGINANYQLVNYGGGIGWNEDLEGVYLISQDSEIEPLIGKCVVISGSISNDWENIHENEFDIDGTWTYNRSSIEVDHIEELEPNNCIDGLDDFNTNSTNDDSNYIKTTGILKFAKRPAPDIAYDIEILLDRPFVDNQNSSGKPEITTRLIVYPSSTEMYRKFINNIGNKVEISGYMEWGYSETRLLRVTKF